MNSSLRLPSENLSSEDWNTGEIFLLRGQNIAIMLIVGTLIMLFNFIGMYSFNNAKTIVKNLQVYITSLMACDFSLGLSICLSPLFFWLSNNSSFMVDLCISVIRTLLIISLQHTAVLSLDRLLSIKQPNFYMLRITPTICKGVCICVWVVSLSYNILVSVLFRFYPMDGRFDVRIYSSFMFVYFSCVFVYMGSSRSIIVCAREHIRRTNVASRLVGSPRDHQNSDTFRLSLVITTASGFLLILYLPAQIFGFLTFIDPDRKLKTTMFFQKIGYPFLVLESLLGPLLYLLRFRETRQMIRGVCCFSTTVDSHSNISG